MPSLLLNILLVEDNLADADLLQEIIDEQDEPVWHLTHVERLSEALHRLKQQPFDLVLLDLSLPDAQGLEMLSRIHDVSPTMPIVVLTGLDDEVMSLEALRRGAQDYLVKGQIAYPLLIRAVRYAIERARTQQVIYQQSAAIAASRDGIAILNHELTYSYLNLAHAEIYGYPSPDDLMGKNWRSLYDGEERFRIEHEIMPVLRKQGYWKGETVGKRDSGERVYQELSLTALSDGGYVCIVRDISDRKQAEASLRLAQFSLDRVSDAVYLVKPDAQFLYVNEAACRSLGYSQQELLNLTMFDVYPAYTPELWAEHWHMLKQQGWRRSESLNRTKDGREFPVEMSSNYLQFNGREFKCVIVRDISARKAAEVALQKSEQKFRTLVANVPGVIYRYLPDERWTVVFISDEIEKITGYPAADFINNRVRSLIDCCHPNDWLMVQHVTERALAHRQPFVLEYRMINRDGGIRWVYHKGQGIWNQDGFLLYLDGAIFDISDRKQAEAQILRLNKSLQQQALDLEAANQELGTTQEFLSTVLDAASDPIFVKDEEHRWVLLNQKFCDFVGYSREALLDKSDYDIFPPEQAKIFWEKDNQLLTTGETQEDEEYITDANGQVRYISTKNSRFIDSFNNRYIVGIIRDMTARKQAEEALRESDERLQAILDNAQTAIYLKDTQGRYILVNQKFQTLFHLPLEQIRGQTDYDLLPPELAYVNQANDRKVLESKTSMAFEEFTLQDDMLHTYLSVKFPLFDREGVPYAVGGISTDITARKQAEAEVLRALEREKELNELKSRFISTTSHEFRTPLTTILGSTELLEHSSHRWTNEKKQKHYSQIRAAVQHMTQLLDDVLTISKSEAGKLPFHSELLNLEAFCHQLVDEMQATTRNNHTLQFTCSGTSLTAEADAKLLRQILQNLLSNAIKYSPANSSIAFTLICTDKMAIFQVRDRGIGIPQADLQHLFESFHRANNVGTIAGTGLGLAIVKRAVELHHGEISVESELGQGTQFTVQIPRLVQERGEMEG
ncbi:PAS domain S-box protein [Pantanalinema rosaneae CENA516]|uniref:sensor histidine kinase n=1 Tax=Pantanalinema rosaneae TaxID=1620701 RepID=UPI003D6F2CF1